MAMVFINATASDPTFDWSALKPTHGLLPREVQAASDDSDLAWLQYMQLCERLEDGADIAVDVTRALAHAQYREHYYLNLRREWEMARARGDDELPF